MPTQDPEKRAASQARWRAEHRDEQNEYHRAWLVEWRSRFARTGEIPGHNRSGYDIGCRCRVCRTAHNDYHRAHRAIRREEAKAAEFDWEGE